MVFVINTQIVSANKDNKGINDTIHTIGREVKSRYRGNRTSKRMA